MVRAKTTIREDLVTVFRNGLNAASEMTRCMIQSSKNEFSESGLAAPCSYAILRQVWPLDRTLQPAHVLTVGNNFAVRDEQRRRKTSI